MADKNKPENMVILDRPMISVEKTEYHEVKITVVGMDGAMERVNQQELLFPLECAEQVGQFLLKIAAANASSNPTTKSAE